MVLDAVFLPKEDIFLDQSTYWPPRRMLSYTLDVNGTVSTLSTLILNGMPSVYLH
jgi:hypothetical protein